VPLKLYQIQDFPEIVIAGSAIEGLDIFQTVCRGLKTERRIFYLKVEKVEEGKRNEQLSINNEQLKMRSED
jgi:hypothetical protein